jgi:hypothetical protein
MQRKLAIHIVRQGGGLLMLDGISHPIVIILAIAVNAALAWATYRVYARAGFPGAWFVAPACFLFPVVGLLSVLLQMAIVDWPVLAPGKEPGSAEQGGAPGAAPDTGHR